MPRLRVMTLNLWGYRGDWPARRDRLINCMQQEDLDVILLQEVSERAWRANQAEEISFLTGYHMAFVPAQHFFPWPSVSEGLAILSRFPMSNFLETELFTTPHLLPTAANERRIAQRVEINLGGMSVVLYNTHFPLTVDARRQAAYRLWTQVVQEEVVLLVVGGDFNAPPIEESIDFLQGKIPMNGLRGELADAWVTAGIGTAETYPTHAPRSRIDYIFYQAEPTVIVQETKVLGFPPDEMSDHGAVVATFSISPTRDTIAPPQEEPVGSLEPTG
ncbi:MAG TPA: endonuclease/exonuclease/phosphatase family protein, partial [Armatimonadota bacterium]